MKSTMQVLYMQYVKREEMRPFFQVSSSRQPVAARVYMCVYVDANESRYIAEQ